MSGERKPAEEAEDDKFTVEVVDDTPEDDKKYVRKDDKEKEGPSGSGEPEKQGEYKPETEADDEELATLSERTRSRIKELTRRYHDERRAREARERENQEAIDFAKRALTENQQLKRLVGAGENAVMAEAKAKAEAMLDGARKGYREAFESGDAGKIADAQVALAKAAAELESVSRYRPREIEKEERQEPQQQQQPQRQQPAKPDPLAVDWFKKNPWFGQDEDMTALAMGVHQRIVQQDGVNPQSADYYSRIDTEVRRRFPERFEKPVTQPERPGASRGGVVAAATRSAAGARVVTLTKSQETVARRLGLTKEQYAAQVLLEAKQNG